MDLIQTSSSYTTNGKVFYLLMVDKKLSFKVLSLSDYCMQRRPTLLQGLSNHWDAKEDKTGCATETTF